MRQAITDANAAAGADDIVFSGVTGVISLLSALPAVTQSMSITGPGADALTIDGGQHETIFLFASATDNQTYLVNDLMLTNGRGSGGGIEIYGITSPKGVILNSTVSGNRALNNEDGVGGGIHCEDCELTVVNSTISGNEAAVSGGGILNSGVLTLRNVTVTGNTANADGGGVFNESGADLFLKNSILAGNVDTGGEAPDCKGSASSQNFNVIGSADGCTIGGVTTNDVVGETPLLAALADNGGPTQTHALLAGSPAIDAGDPAGCVDEDGDPLTTDQRGFDRSVGSACDIGAFEAGACGDGVVDPATGEVCDDGNSSDTDACLNECVAASCGDGLVRTGVEACDDGNNTDGDGCSAMCATEDGGSTDAGGGCSLIR